HRPPQRYDGAAGGTSGGLHHGDGSFQSHRAAAGDADHARAGRCARGGTVLRLTNDSTRYRAARGYGASCLKNKPASENGRGLISNPERRVNLFCCLALPSNAPSPTTRRLPACPPLPPVAPVLPKGNPQPSICRILIDTICIKFDINWK